jgi:cytochrome c oxidase cbb3-type subunit 3/ubiquinol-cytochrome c reductase cytochrome c subunit
MNLRALLLASALTLSGLGCKSAPGRPQPGDQARRPDQVLDFPTLYKENCSACHGDRGTGGAAIALANPLYLSFAGVQNIERITANGVPGTMMPPFSNAAGGTLTPQQITALAQGMTSAWGGPAAAHNPIAYAASLPADPAAGQQAFASFCARCHAAATPATHTGSLIDPAYLALISDQGLRSFIVAGHSPPQASPPLTDQQVTGVVAWLASHRTPQN